MVSIMRQNGNAPHLKFYDIFTWHHYFWFLGVLFIVSILFYPISGKIRSKKELFILAIICTFFHYMLSKYFVNSINENFLKCFTAMVFYSVGFFVRDKISDNTMYNVIEKYPLCLIFFSIKGVEKYFLTPNFSSMKLLKSAYFDCSPLSLS